MFNEKTIENYLGAVGPNATDELIQSGHLIVDMDKFDSVQYRIEILQITDADFHIETALTLTGPWTSLISYSTGGERLLEMECDPDATYQVERYVRWRLAANAATWDVCFMIAAVFEKLGDDKSEASSANRRRTELASSTAQQRRRS
jgi:hypothetical protein